MDRVELSRVESFAVYDKDRLNYEIDKILKDDTVRTFEVIVEQKDIERNEEDLTLSFYVVNVYRELS